MRQSYAAGFSLWVLFRLASSLELLGGNYELILNGTSNLLIEHVGEQQTLVVNTTVLDSQKRTFVLNRGGGYVLTLELSEISFAPQYRDRSRATHDNQYLIKQLQLPSSVYDKQSLAMKTGGCRFPIPKQYNLTTTRINGVMMCRDSEGSSGGCYYNRSSLYPQDNATCCSSCRRAYPDTICADYSTSFNASNIQSCAFATSLDILPSCSKQLLNYTNTPCNCTIVDGYNVTNCYDKGVASKALLQKCQISFQALLNCSATESTCDSGCLNGKFGAIATLPDFQSTGEWGCDLEWVPPKGVFNLSKILTFNGQVVLAEYETILSDLSSVEQLSGLSTLISNVIDLSFINSVPNPESSYVAFTTGLNSPWNVTCLKSYQSPFSITQQPFYSLNSMNFNGSIASALCELTPRQNSSTVGLIPACDTTQARLTSIGSDGVFHYETYQPHRNGTLVTMTLSNQSNVFSVFQQPASLSLSSLSLSVRRLPSETDGDCSWFALDLSFQIIECPGTLGVELFLITDTANTTSTTVLSSWNVAVNCPTFTDDYSVISFSFQVFNRTQIVSPPARNSTNATLLHSAPYPSGCIPYRFGVQLRDSGSQSFQMTVQSMTPIVVDYQIVSFDVSGDLQTLVSASCGLGAVILLFTAFMVYAHRRHKREIEAEKEKKRLRKSSTNPNFTSLDIDNTAEPDRTRCCWGKCKNPNADTATSNGLTSLQWGFIVVVVVIRVILMLLVSFWVLFAVWRMMNANDTQRLSDMSQFMDAAWNTSAVIRDQMLQHRTDETLRQNRQMAQQSQICGTVMDRLVALKRQQMDTASTINAANRNKCNLDALKTGASTTGLLITYNNAINNYAAQWRQHEDAMASDSRSQLATARRYVGYAHSIISVCQFFGGCHYGDVDYDLNGIENGQPTQPSLSSSDAQVVTSEETTQSNSASYQVPYDGFLSFFDAPTNRVQDPDDVETPDVGLNFASLTALFSSLAIVFFTIADGVRFSRKSIKLARGAAKSARGAKEVKYVKDPKQVFQTGTDNLVEDQDDLEDSQETGSKGAAEGAVTGTPTESMGRRCGNRIKTMNQCCRSMPFPPKDLFRVLYLILFIVAFVYLEQFLLQIVSMKTAVDMRMANIITAQLAVGSTVTNDGLIRSAHALNTYQLVDLAKVFDNRFQQLQIEVAIFNTRENDTMLNFQNNYITAANDYAGVAGLGAARKLVMPSCEVLMSNISLVSVDKPVNECPLDPIDVRIFTGYQHQLMQVELYTGLQPYVTASQNVISRTITFIIVILVIMILHTILANIVYRVLKNWNVVRVIEHRTIVFSKHVQNSGYVVLTEDELRRLSLESAVPKSTDDQKDKSGNEKLAQGPHRPVFQELGQYIKELRAASLQFKTQIPKEISEPLNKLLQVEEANRNKLHGHEDLDIYVEALRVARRNNAQPTDIDGPLDRLLEVDESNRRLSTIQKNRLSSVAGNGSDTGESNVSHMPDRETL